MSSKNERTTEFRYAAQQMFSNLLIIKEYDLLVLSLDTLYIKNIR